MTTIEAWIERLPELCQGYEPQNILNMDELELFFMVLPENGLTEKKQRRKKIETTNDRHIYCGI